MYFAFYAHLASRACASRGDLILHAISLSLLMISECCCRHLARVWWEKSNRPHKELKKRTRPFRAFSIVNARVTLYRRAFRNFEYVFFISIFILYHSDVKDAQYIVVRDI